jgi:hypothetical protein
MKSRKVGGVHLQPASIELKAGAPLHSCNPIDHRCDSAGISVSNGRSGDLRGAEIIDMPHLQRHAALAKRKMRMSGKSRIANIPILSVHDSFIVPYDHSLHLKAAMHAVASATVGTYLEISCDRPGLDEVADRERAALAAGRDVLRSEGYLARLGG